MRQLIIVGIDPGTTAAYAVLDVDGQLIDASSSKNYNINTLLSRITSIGRVIAVGCDKKKVPDVVQRFAVKTGARLFSPEEDMLVQEKKEMVKKFSNKISNTHQLDAVASALFAFHKVYSAIKKVKYFAERNDKKKIENALLEKVVKDEKSIADALAEIEKPLVKVEKKQKLIPKEYTKNELTLANRVKDLEKENKLLREYGASLRKKLSKDADKEKKLLQKLNHKEKPKKAELMQEKTINILNKQLVNLYSEITRLKQESDMLTKALFSLKNKVVAKKLDNLGWKHYSEISSKLQIGDGDVLFVENPQIYSEKTLREIKKYVNTIIYRKKPSRLLVRQFNTIDVARLSCKEYERFILITKSSLDKELKAKDILNIIVSEYKESRTE